LKVALIILHADPARGGAERYTVDLGEALRRRGHDVSVISSDTEQPRGFTRTGRYRGFLASVQRRVAAERFDILHAMLPVPGCDVYHPHAGVAAAAMEKFNVWFNPRRRAMARVERALMDRANGPLVICLSDYVKRFVRQYYPELPDERMVRLFNAVDLARFSPPETRTKSDWVNALIIAQDYERKGLGEAIRAVAKVPDKRLRLIVVGKQDPASYAALAKQLGVADRVVFHPPTSKPEDFYREADFFVLPTKHDPCSLVVLEALAMGLPVISTVFNGATEVMTDGVHGLILNDPADVDAVARAMTTLCDDARRTEMTAACKTLRPVLAYEHHVDELMAIYERAIARRQAKSGASE
jgi:UDP-glucose:(heptosyl)LPS alpha-1,3-glucosyltransferase